MAAFNQDELSIVQEIHITPTILSDYTYVRLTTNNLGEVELYTPYWNPAYLTNKLITDYPTSYFTDSALYAPVGGKVLDNVQIPANSSVIITNIMDTLLAFYPEYDFMTGQSTFQRVLYCEEFNITFLIANVALSLGSPPVASNLALNLDGLFKENEPISLSYDYNDVEADPLDIAGTTLELYAYDDIIGTNPVLLSTLSHAGGTTTGNGTKTITALNIPVGAGGKFIGLEVTPVATNAPTTGVKQTFINPQVIVEDNAALVLNTDQETPTAYSFFLVHEAGEAFYLEFDDGSPAEYYVGTGASVTYNHTFPIGGGAVTACGNPDHISSILISNSGTVGTLDLSKLDVFGGQLLADTNPNLTQVVMPTTGTPIYVDIELDNCDLTGTFSLGSVVGAFNSNSTLRLRSNPNLIAFNTNASVADVGYGYLDLSFTGLVNVDVNNFNSVSTLAISSNIAMLTLTLPTNNSVIMTNLQLQNNFNYAGGCLDLSGMTLGMMSFFSAFNTPWKCMVGPPAAAQAALAVDSNYFITCWLFGCSMDTLDLSAFLNLGGALRLQNNPLTSNIILPAAASGGTFTLFDMSNTQSTGTITYSTFANWTTSGNFLYDSNPDLESLALLGFTTGAIETIEGHNTKIVTASGHLGSFNSIILDTTDVDFDYTNNAMPSTAIDNLAKELDNRLGTGSGDIKLENNSAPTATGITFINSLITKGYNVTFDP